MLDSLIMIFPYRCYGLLLGQHIAGRAMRSTSIGSCDPLGTSRHTIRLYRLEDCWIYDKPSHLVLVIPGTPF